MMHYNRAHRKTKHAKKRGRGRPRGPYRKALTIVPEGNVQPSPLQLAISKEITCHVNACPACGFDGIQMVNRAMHLAAAR